MNRPQPLKPGDRIEILAPASRSADEALKALQVLLENWGLQVQIASDIFAEHPFCAGFPLERFKHFERALYDPSVKAIICIRGGYGSMHLIPYLMDKKDIPVKWFLGMSDITALHIFFQQYVQLTTMHASLSVNHLDKSSIEAVRALLFGEIHNTKFLELENLNKPAENMSEIHALLIGGNLTLVQASIGTCWEIQTRDKVVLLEEINERAYEIDRILTHLKQANILNDAKAIIFGDFLKTDEPDGSSGCIDFALSQFADTMAIPVMKVRGIGHGTHNMPVLLGANTAFIHHKKTKMLELKYL